MKVKLQRWWVLLLVFSLLIQTTQIPVMAHIVGENPLNANATLETGDYSLDSYNDFGSMLKNQIQEEQTTDGEYSIFDIVVNNNIATITYSAAENSTIVAAIYDESGKMLASGKGTVDADEDSIDIRIDIDFMPEYFLISAYMLDEQSKSPRCESYTSQYYTKDFQDFLKKTVNDFDPDRVLNLDEDESTNFAVYHDATKIIDHTDSTNIIGSIDEENRIYKIQNIDESIRTLNQGDIFVYHYDENNAIIVKVGEIYIDGSTATIVGQEASMEEVFSYVKIDAESDASNFEVDNSNLDEGLTYIGSGEEPQLLGAIDIDKSKSIKLNYDFVDAAKDDNESSEGDNNEDNIKFGVDLGITFEIKANLQFYMKWNYIFFKFSLTNTLDISGTLSVKGYINKAKLGDINIPLKPGINIGLTPSFVLEASAEIEVSASVEKGCELGFSSKNKKLSFTFGKTKWHFSAQLEGKIFFGLEFDLNLNAGIIGIKAAKAGLIGTYGLEAIGTLKIDVLEEKHDCIMCLDGDIFLRNDAKAELELLKWKLSFPIHDRKIKLGDFYFSVDYGESGLGTCPHISYEVGFFVKNKENRPLKNVQITVEGNNWEQKEEWKTNAEGEFTGYLPNGKYKITYRLGKQIEQKEITIEDKPIYPSVIMEIENTGEDNPSDTEDPGEIIDPDDNSKICGDNLKWKVDGDVLIIYGTGDMYDYSHKKEDNNFSPWYDSRWSEVIIEEGVTSIGNAAFYKVSSVNFYLPESITRIGEYAFSDAYIGNQKLTLPNSLERIEMAAFSKASVKTVVIPEKIREIAPGTFWRCTLTTVQMFEGIEVIGYDAFSYCEKLKSISIPNSVEIIGKSAFSNTSIETIEIPEKVREIADNTFKNCNKLVSVQMHGGIEKIGKSVFSYCSKLENISIPDSVYEIGSSAFSGSGLVNIDLSRQLKVVKPSTFLGCDKLQHIELKNSVVYIDDYAFGLCTNLKSIRILNPDCKISTVACIDKSTTFYAPTGGKPSESIFYKSIEQYVNTFGNPLVDTGTSIINLEETPDILLCSIEPEVIATVTSGSALTKAYTNLPGNTEFLFVASKSDSKENILESENLLYIGQSASDAQGNIAFQYILKEDNTPVNYYLFGYETIATKTELQAGDITVSDLTYNGMEQTPSIIVTHNGIILREGEDYIIGGSTSGIQAGTYYFTVSGINHYTGTINGTFTIAENSGHPSDSSGWPSGGTSSFWDTYFVDSQRAANAKKELETYFAQYEFRNEMSKADIEQSIAGLLLRLGYQDVKAELENDYTQTNATEQADGTVSATITITCGTATETFWLILRINRLPEQVQDQSNLTGNEIVKLKGLKLLPAKGNPKSKKSLTLKWSRAAQADGYEVYWSYCGYPKNYTLLRQTTKLSATQTKMNSKKNYLYYVLAYRFIDGKKVYIAKSPAIHVAMPGSKRTNVKSIAVPKTRLTLYPKQTYWILPTATVEESGKKVLQHVSEYRYFTTDPNVAKVNRTTGKISAQGQGSCDIYVVANNGVYKKIKVTVE